MTFRRVWGPMASWLTAVPVVGMKTPAAHGEGSRLANLTCPPSQDLGLLSTMSCQPVSCWLQHFERNVAQADLILLAVAASCAPKVKRTQALLDCKVGGMATSLKKLPSIGSFRNGEAPAFFNHGYHCRVQI